MSFLINSYDMRPPAVTMDGTASLWLGGLSSLAGREFGGVAAMVFGQNAALKAGKAMTGLAELRMAQVAVLVAGVVPMIGSAGMLFGQAALLRAALLLEGGTDLVFGEAGTLRKGEQMAGVTDLLLAQAAALKVRKLMEGESILTTGQASALVCDYGTVADPAITPSSGSPTLIANGATITITTSTPVAQIYWTHDGTDPVVEMDADGVWTCSNGTLYTGSFAADFNAWDTAFPYSEFTIKAIATKQNWEASGIDSQLFNRVA